ncbi:hypothetical protein GGR57DRAFT_498168 [Xylariaceae sp. FL1272]|nr:hypothetical protein GGR57DRAFT_498168 [Xylariaceae sp. FL1272]
MRLPSGISALCQRWTQLSTLRRSLAIFAVLTVLIDATEQWTHITSVGTGAIAGGIPLRLMFIGASMAMGLGHNGGRRSHGCV